jgi:RecB family endonuclease NucS
MVAPLKAINQTETESILEEVIVSCPEILIPGLKLVGRQTDTPGGPLDLLGVDANGRLVVFELKRGNLTRDAVAQIIDYGSYLAELDPERLSNHISERSGRLGIGRIEDFILNASWAP